MLFFPQSLTATVIVTVKSSGIIVPEYQLFLFQIRKNEMGTATSFLRSRSDTLPGDAAGAGGVQGWGRGRGLDEGAGRRGSNRH